MKRRNTERILKQYFAIFAIYLIISLTFFTAQSLAVLNYNISGEGEVQGYAKKEGDLIKLVVTADSNVSFVTNQGEKPLDSCLPNGNGVICDQPFAPGTINTNVKNLSFTLKQLQGTPLIKNGNLYIDGNAPTGTIVGHKTGEGIDFAYNFRESDCQESGIGEISIEVQGKPSIVKTIKSKNCTVIGNAFMEFSDTYEKVITYYAIVTDRVGNVYETDTFNLSGDFRAPSVTNDFKIFRGTVEMTDFSSVAEVTADVVIEVEDSDVPTVRGDLSSLNNNPALNTQYKNTSATCTKTSDSIYECKFVGIRIKPSRANLNINITAIDNDKNMNKVSLTKLITLRNSAGGVSYIGPLKSHCTADLTECEMRSGMQLLRMELDATSAYEHTVVNIGVNNDKTYGLCKLDEVWLCTGAYTIPTGVQSVKVFVAESRDDYGNYLRSDLERTVRIDNDPPVKISEMSVANNNNNVNCSVSGDELTLHVRVKDLSSEVKMYVNTSEFTTQDTQKGECVMTLGGDWDCTLIVRDFSSSPPAPVTKNVIVEDLAGNQLPIPYTFEVCAISSSGMPNVIFGNPKQNSIPNIDRKTASRLPVKVLIPLTFDIRNGASIMYLSVERCTARDMNNMDVAGSSSYFMPANPTNGKESSLVLSIGSSGAMLPLGEMQINCTISARIRSGQTVYLRDERETITVKVKTFNQPLGTLDETTEDIIAEQKQALRDITARIDKRVEQGKILKFICDVSSIIVKVNSVIQALKAVVYLVCVVLEASGVGSWAAKIWKPVNTVASGMDKIVQRFVWPTGIDPKSWIGYIWKYTCIIYNCKFYTLSGLLEIGLDAAGLVSAALGNVPIDPESKKALERCAGMGDGCVAYADGSARVERSNSDGTKTEAVKYRSGRTVETQYDKDSHPTSQSVTEGKGMNYKRTTTTFGPDGKATGGTVSYTNTDNPNSDKNVPFFDNAGQMITGIDPDDLEYVRSENVYGYETVDGQVVPVNSYINVFKDRDTGREYSHDYGSGFGAYAGRVQVDASPLSNNIYKVNIPFTSGSSSGVSVTAFSDDTHFFNTYFDKNYKNAQSSTNSKNRATSRMESTVNSELTTRNTQLYSDIDRQDWIINPYRSEHYDGLCGPATTYNLQKERQIRCMYVTCLEESRQTGMPSSVCNYVYKVNNCLYLESAQYTLNPNIWEQIGTGLVKQVMASAIGLITALTYNKLCKKYIDKGGSGENAIFKGWKAAACGVFGVALKWQELWAMMTDPAAVWGDLMEGNTPKDPAEVYDYCEGGAVYEYTEGSESW